MAGPKINQLTGIATETAPLVVVHNFLERARSEVPLNTLLTEDVNALGATNDHPTLPAPPAEQFAAITASFKFATIVELVACFTDCNLQDVVKSNLWHSR